jgi:uncharacterized repeat protein (TIGR03803 family)
MTLNGDVTVFHRFRNDTDGANPESSLTAGSDGALYGTTYTGIYRITQSGAFEMAHVLGPDEGFFTNDVVRARDGFLYGTASQGQDSEFYGTIFRLSTNGEFTTLFRFHGGDGQLPGGPLLQASDGRLYGVTLEGGQGSGTVFRFDPAKGLTTVHAFDDADGALPEGALVQGTDGALYGVTEFGGIGEGTVYRLDLQLP